jgi:putative zinc finger/helix-turn-helix YgiT family protein
MLEACPCCEEEVEFESLRQREDFEVRGERIAVEVSCRRCPGCGEEFDDRSAPDPFEAAYREYRRRHGLLQPEDIVETRKRAGLSTDEAAVALGLPPEILAGYEAGLVQSEEHDRLIRGLAEPGRLPA